MPRLAIGPINTAGQAYQWSESVSRNLGFSSWSFAGTRRSIRRLDGPAHHRIPHHRVRPRILRKLWVQKLLGDRTHILVESMMPLYGDPIRDMLDDELYHFLNRGVSVGAILHGSDIRSPSQHMNRLEHSYFQLWDDDPRNALAAQSARRREALVDSGIPSFVSTPDLILDLPDATWLPLVIDTRRWANNRGALQSPRPVVLHAPSRRKPSLKGSDIIEPVLVELDRRRLIDYRAPSGFVPHHEMTSLVKGSDIVVEQILAGSYGVSAVEGMAAGRLVIGFVGDDVRAMMPEEPPIIDATPEDFCSTILAVLDSRASYAELAASGPAFVQRFHSGSTSAQALASFLGT